MPVENLVLLATPIDFDQGPSQLRPGRLAANVDETGNVSAEVLRTAFMSLDPGAEITSRVNLWQRMDDDAYLAAHRVMTGWGNDHIRFPGATAKQMERLFSDHNPILDGTLQLGGRRVDLSAITVPFLSVVGEKDHIAPPATSDPLLGLVGSADKTELRVPAGHVGLFVGASAHKRCVPGIIDWIAERSAET